LYLKKLQSQLGSRLKTGHPIARYTAARIGGPADEYVEVVSSDQLAEVVQMLWDAGAPYVILGGGSNILVSDSGIRGVVVHNLAKSVRFEPQKSPPVVWAESGANFGMIARQAAKKGLSGLEWAAGIPGTVGGAVVGNAGAHGGDMAGNLTLAKILHKDKGQEVWQNAQMEFVYRSSTLKRNPGMAVVLEATLRLAHSQPVQIQPVMDQFLAHRRRTQPPGASMGSMFKNPPGDYAGRLIEAVGLKGTRLGDAQISELHANFFVNCGHAKAVDVLALIQLAQKTVAQEFGVELELEIELIGEW